MKTMVYTSTISPNLLQWLEQETKRQGRTRRDLIEEALCSYKKELMKKGFERASNDADIIEMAEMGMGEYAQRIKNV